MHLRKQGAKDFCSERSCPSLPLPHTHHHFSSSSELTFTPPPPTPVPPAASTCSPTLPRAGEAGPGSLPQATARRPLPHPCAQWAGKGMELDASMPPLTRTWQGRGGEEVGRCPCQMLVNTFWGLSGSMSTLQAAPLSEPQFLPLSGEHHSDAPSSPPPPHTHKVVLRPKCNHRSSTLPSVGGTSP